MDEVIYKDFFYEKSVLKQILLFADICRLNHQLFESAAFIERATA